MARELPLWVGKTDNEKVPPREVYEPRLLSKIVVDPGTGCWLWQGAHCRSGYGHVKVGSRFEKAHRLSYLIYKGPIEPGLNICHVCDRPQCINPEHLWAGSQRDNLADCRAKGRYRQGTSHGEANGSAKLTAADVAIIRETPNTYGSGLALARRFGVRPATISEIRHGHTWRRK